MSTRALSVCVLMALSIAACSRELSHDDAKNVIERNKLIRPSDNVSVDAISSTDSAEAIVRATIAGNTTNLKFRRFDKGWTWEFVETKSGGWIAPDVAMGQIREEHRTVAASAWADQNKAIYAATAKTMAYIALYHVPNPTEVEHFEAWMRSKKLMVAVAQEDPKLHDRLDVIANDRWMDAWGSEIETSFSSKDNSTLIRSSGADKTTGTDDDLLCLNTFRRGVENGRMVWQQDKSWRLPEGFTSELDPFFREGTDKLEHAKVLKP